MTDIVLTCFRDEADVIETFVLFYLAMGFDAVYAVDNGSVDGGDLLVEALAARGLPVVLERDPRLGYERNLTEYFHWAGTAANARWIFFLDADEFVLFPTTAPAFLNSLSPETNSLILRLREVWPSMPDAAGEQPHFLSSTRLEGRFDDTFKQVAQWRPDARIYAGKHRIDFAGQVAERPDVPYIRHYKYRTLAQAMRKEENRIEADGMYSDAELERISAFGLEASRKWIVECRRHHEAESWRQWFDPALPAVFDDEMARWAATWLSSGNR
jgi:glycosyltransferase involved in cell wall biosynthesis